MPFEDARSEDEGKTADSVAMGNHKRVDISSMCEIECLAQAATSKADTGLEDAGPRNLDYM